MGSQDGLTAYLKEVSNRPFAWGQHDCLIFTNTAWQHMHGRGWADDWLGRYMNGARPRSRAQLRKEYGWQNLRDAVDARLRRITHFPPTGALVTTNDIPQGSFYLGVAFGIAVGARAAFVGMDGLVYLPLEHVQNAWVAA